MLWSGLKMFCIKNNDKKKQHNIKTGQCDDTASFFKTDFQKIKCRFQMFFLLFGKIELKTSIQCSERLVNFDIPENKTEIKPQDSNQNNNCISIEFILVIQGRQSFAGCYINPKKDG